MITKQDARSGLAIPFSSSPAKVPDHEVIEVIYVLEILCIREAKNDYPVGWSGLALLAWRLPLWSSAMAVQGTASETPFCHSQVEPNTLIEAAFLRLPSSLRLSL